MSADVQQINNAVQEVNNLARKNKNTIEGLASEVRKFKADGVNRHFDDEMARAVRSCLHTQTG